ncbi:Ig-like domain-containing protein [Leptospira jelokensis]|uniref:Ig-like domain-containing protein n=1 Tax=Leptospira jelokensis TaxID=2484931 RepID=UPI00109125E9|nr:Ig-like domain-containing protein [Leptospira jelokensis]TGM01190.1 Ig-like protein [Leptospira jelokensis]
MKNVNRNFFWIPICFLFLHSCDSKFGSSKEWLSILATDDAPKVVSFSPASGSQNVPSQTEISIVWNQPMEIQSCVSAFSLDPPIKGNFETTEFSLTFKPNQNLAAGGYVIRLTKQCENKKGKDLDRVYSIPFSVVEPVDPKVEAFFVSSGNRDECLSGGIPINRVLGLTESVCNGTPGPPTFQVVFNKPMNKENVAILLRFEPFLSYRLEWETRESLLIQFDSLLPTSSRFQFILPSGVLALDGKKTSEPIRFDFFVGVGVTDPSVIGFGLESQNCGIGIQELGSASHSRWDANTCFWSSGLPILTPENYHFRGGDDGTGDSGETGACADVNTDNFKIFFNEYMDTTSVISASRLTKISPPSSNIRLSSWVWNHCQSEYPYGCRELTYSFAESEASCNGSLFGNNVTGGDFNLTNSSTSPNFYPFYEFRLDSDAKSSLGKKMQHAFVIQMEAK